MRAWRGLGDFEGRSALRSWLYRIATNVCLDQLSGRSRRALPMDLSGPRGSRSGGPSARRPGTAGGAGARPQVLPEDGDPAERAVQRESIRLAFVAALQHLPPPARRAHPPRGAAVEGRRGGVAARHHRGVGEQRAAAGAGDTRLRRWRPDPRPLDDDDRELLARYVDAFERYDIDAFVQLLHDDATQHMPPYEMWLRGRDDIGAWMLGPGRGCRNSRLVQVMANGTPAIAQYRPREGGGHEPWALHVLEIEDGRVAHISSFLDHGEGLFRRLGLPESPE